MLWTKTLSGTLAVIPLPSGGINEDEGHVLSGTTVRRVGGMLLTILQGSDSPHHKESSSPALAGVAQLVGVLSHNRRVVGLTPRLCVNKRQPIDVSLFHQCFSLTPPLSSPLPLKAMKKKNVLR